MSEKNNKKNIFFQIFFCPFFICEILYTNFVFDLFLMQNQTLVKNSNIFIFTRFGLLCQYFGHYYQFPNFKIFRILDVKIFFQAVFFLCTLSYSIKNVTQNRHGEPIFFSSILGGGVSILAL